MQPRILIPDHPQVTLEYRKICNIEPDQRRKEPYVRFGDMITEEVRAVVWLSEVLFQAIKRCEDRVHVLFVRFLSGSETGLVDPVVDGVIDPVIHSFDVFAKVRREDAFLAFGRFAQTLWDESIKLGVEHSDNFAGLIADNGLCKLYQHLRDTVGGWRAYPSFCPKASALDTFPHTPVPPSHIAASNS